MDKEKIIKYIKNNDLLTARAAIDKMLCMPAENSKYYDNIIRQAIKYIEKNYNKKIRLEDVASCVGFSKEYMSKIFKEYMHMNYRNYINFVRIKNAENLLLQTDIPVKKVSEMIGIEDSCYFTKVFKKVNGCTPNKFRAVYSFYYKN